LILGRKCHEKGPIESPKCGGKILLKGFRENYVVNALIGFEPSQEEFNDYYSKCQSVPWAMMLSALRLFKSKCCSYNYFSGYGAER